MGGFVRAAARACIADAKWRRGRPRRLVFVRAVPRTRVSRVATVLRQDGPMPVAAPDFRLYPSNSLEILAGLLAAELRQPVPGRSILEPEVVLVQSNGTVSFSSGASGCARSQATSSARRSSGRLP